MARLNTDGSFDTSYGTNGVATARLVDGANYSNGMVLQADDKPILAGYTIQQTTYNMAMVRFTTDGFTGRRVRDLVPDLPALSRDLLILAGLLSEVFKTVGNSRAVRFSLKSPSHSASVVH